MKATADWAPDVEVIGSGTVYLIVPTTKRGEEWINTYVDKDSVRLGRGVGVGHQYIHPILQAMAEDGLIVKGGN